jgi:hypothetical protein
MERGQMRAAVAYEVGSVTGGFLASRIPPKRAGAKAVT